MDLRTKRNVRKLKQEEDKKEERGNKLSKIGQRSKKLDAEIRSLFEGDEEDIQIANILLSCLDPFNKELKKKMEYYSYRR